MLWIPKLVLHVYLVVYVEIVASEHIQFINFVHDTSIDNKIPSDSKHVIQTNKTSTMEECAYLCYRNIQCVAYFFTQTTTDCQLMNNDVSIGTSMSRRDSTRYFYNRNNREGLKTPRAIPTSSGLTSTTPTPTSKVSTPRSTTPTPTSTTHTQTSTTPTPKSTTRTQTSTTPTPTSTAYTKTSTATPFSCQAISGGWVMLNYPDGSVNHYKLFTDTYRTQIQATKKCSELTAKLPVFVTTEKQDTFIERILTPCRRFGRFWANGENFSSSNWSFYTSDTHDNIPENTGLWSEGRPNGRDTQHCIQMASQFDFKYDDTSCERKEVYAICER